jgi:hypothetical protein
MAGSFKKGAIPPDPRVVIPMLEDYIDVSSLAGGLPAAPGDDRTVITWGIERKIDGQSLQRLITDSKNVRG